MVEEAQIYWNLGKIACIVDDADGTFIPCRMFALRASSASGKDFAVGRTFALERSIRPGKQSLPLGGH